LYAQCSDFPDTADMRVTPAGCTTRWEWYNRAGGLGADLEVDQLRGAITKQLEDGYVVFDPNKGPAFLAAIMAEHLIHKHYLDARHCDEIVTVLQNEADGALLRRCEEYAMHRFQNSPRAGRVQGPCLHEHTCKTCTFCTVRNLAWRNLAWLE